jgi:phosphatidylinositol 3-kinase
MQPPTSSTQIPTTSHTSAATSISSSFAPDSNLWTVIDPDVARENPVEDKHRRLVRSHRSSPYDRELKPNAKIRDELGVGLRFSVH